MSSSSSGFSPLYSHNPYTTGPPSTVGATGSSSSSSSSSSSGRPPHQDRPGSPPKVEHKIQLRKAPPCTLTTATCSEVPKPPPNASVCPPSSSTAELHKVVDGLLDQNRQIISALNTSIAHQTPSRPAKRLLQGFRSTPRVSISQTAGQKESASHSVGGASPIKERSSNGALRSSSLKSSSSSSFSSSCSNTSIMSSILSSSPSPFQPSSTSLSSPFFHLEDYCKQNMKQQFSAGSSSSPTTRSDWSSEASHTRDSLSFEHHSSSSSSSCSSSSLCSFGSAASFTPLSSSCSSSLNDMECESKPLDKNYVCLFQRLQQNLMVLSLLAAPPLPSNTTSVATTSRKVVTTPSPPGSAGAVSSGGESRTTSMSTMKTAAFPRLHPVGGHLGITPPRPPGKEVMGGGMSVVSPSCCSLSSSSSFPSIKPPAFGGVYNPASAARPSLVQVRVSHLPSGPSPCRPPLPPPAGGGGGSMVVSSSFQSPNVPTGVVVPPSSQLGPPVSETSGVSAALLIDPAQPPPPKPPHGMVTAPPRSSGGGGTPAQSTEPPVISSQPEISTAGWTAEDIEALHATILSISSLEQEGAASTPEDLLTALTEAVPSKTVDEILQYLLQYDNSQQK